MSTSEQVNVGQSTVQSYSRSNRSARKVSENKSHQEASRRTRVPQPHKLYLLILSVVVSCLSVSIPVFTDMANSMQSQNLYIGLMLTKGQLPFTDMFTASGFLYYALIALAYCLGSTLWLMPIQIVTFYLSGIYFYKLVSYFTSSRRVTVAFSDIFYLLDIALGSGGLYPIQFAMPFIMVSSWFLTKCFADIIKDEVFILYGFADAAAVLLEPRTLVFWGLSLLTTIVYNLAQKHFARGFHQLLCIISGAAPVFYTVGYFILNLQVSSSYISQAIIYQFMYFATSDSNSILTLLFQVVVALVSGILFGALTFGKIIKGTSDKVSRWPIFLVFLGFLVIDLSSQSYHFYHLLTVLPFGLLLTVMALGERYQRSLTKTSYRREKSSNDDKGTFGSYLSRYLYLPILLLIIGVGQPVVSYFLSSGIDSERSTATGYLKKQTSSDDTIYVWDTSSKIGIKSRLASSLQFISPVVSTTKTSNEKTLEDELLQNLVSYTVVNNDEKIFDMIKNDISSSYEEISISGVSSSTVYHRK